MSTSSSPALGQQDPCLSPMSLFQIPQINRTTPRSSSWAWSVSLEITPPRFPTVLHSGGFPARSGWVIFHCRYTRFLHLPSTDGHCIIVNNSAVNMEAQILFKSLISVISDKCPEVWDSFCPTGQATSCGKCWPPEGTRQSSRWQHQVTSHQWCKGPLSPTYVPTPVIFLFFLIITLLTGVECGFDFYFQGPVILSTFSHTFSIWMSPLEKCLLKTFACFLTGLLLFSIEL